jgi:hypothetical protein
MAKSSAKRASAAKAPAATGGGAMRPMLIAAGLSLYWFVAYQGAAGTTDVPVWVYAIVIGMRLLADFVGALVIVYALQLLLVLTRLAVSYLRGLWLQASN